MLPPLLPRIFVQDIKYVINYDMPKELEDYVHRIGRTGRKTNEGECVRVLGMHVFSASFQLSFVSLVEAIVA